MIVHHLSTGMCGVLGVKLKQLPRCFHIPKALSLIHNSAVIISHKVMIKFHIINPLTSDRHHEVPKIWNIYAKMSLFCYFIKE